MRRAHLEQWACVNMKNWKKLSGTHNSLDIQKLVIVLRSPKVIDKSKTALIPRRIISISKYIWLDSKKLKSLIGKSQKYQDRYISAGNGCSKPQVPRASIYPLTLSSWMRPNVANKPDFRILLTPIWQRYIWGSHSHFIKGLTPTS